MSVTGPLANVQELSPESIQELKKQFTDDQIGHMCCLGRCHENSAFHYKGHNYSGWRH